MFSSEDAAKKRLDELRARGVRSAQTGERDTQVSKVWLQLRGDASLNARLREIAKSFAGTEVHDCPAPSKPAAAPPVKPAPAAPPPAGKK